MENVVSAIPAACPPFVTQCAGPAVTLRGEAPPILGVATSPIRSSRLRPIYVALCVIVLLLLLLPGLCVLGIASYFHLSSSTRALRSAVMESVPGQWHKRIGLNVGSLTVDLVRFGSVFLPLPPDARAALQTLNSGEVGVYQFNERITHPDYAAILTTADKSMRRRGWERIVGVAQGGQFVAVYAPENIDPKELSCCVAVLDDENLVVVSARGNISPLLEIVERHIHDNRPILAKF